MLFRRPDLILYAVLVLGAVALTLSVLAPGFSLDSDVVYQGF